MAAKSFPSQAIQKGNRLSSKHGTSHVRAAESDSSRHDGSMLQEFAWQILSIHNQLDDIQASWAAAFAVTRPQWLILSAVRTLDKGNGIPVKDISAKLGVDPSFVTTQSKMLEKQGLLRRVSSKEDARVVLMSLTDKTLKSLARLHARHVESDKLVFSDFSDNAVRDLKIKLGTIRERLAKAAVIIKSED